MIHPIPENPYTRPQEPTLAPPRQQLVPIPQNHSSSYNGR